MFIEQLKNIKSNDVDMNYNDFHSILQTLVDKHFSVKIVKYKTNKWKNNVQMDFF